VKAEALVYALANTVEEKQAETVNERLVNIKADSLVGALIDTLPEEEAETLIDPHFKVNPRGYLMLCLTRYQTCPM